MGPGAGGEIDRGAGPNLPAPTGQLWIPEPNHEQLGWEFGFRVAWDVKTSREGR